MRMRVMPFIIGTAAAAGGLLAYFIDPKQGRRRRNVARDRLVGTFNRTARRGRRFGRLVGARSYGWWQRARHVASEGPPADDVELAHKVESEIFRDPAVPKGKINVDAVGGTVVLRGQVERPEMVRDLEQRARRIEGVRSVENLLHLPETPAPNKPSPGTPQAGEAA